MIVALLNQKGRVGKTTLALHLAGQWAWQGMRITLIDAAPQGSALDWSQQHSREGLSRLFSVVGLARDMLHREAPELARDVDHVVINGSPRVAVLMRSAPLAADLLLIPVQPSRLDGCASAKMLSLRQKARIYRPRIAARFALNRCEPGPASRARPPRPSSIMNRRCRRAPPSANASSSPRPHSRGASLPRSTMQPVSPFG